MDVQYLINKKLKAGVEECDEAYFACRGITFVPLVWYCASRLNSRTSYRENISLRSRSYYIGFHDLDPLHHFFYHLVKLKSNMEG
jgi:hypothetical protein